MVVEPNGSRVSVVAAVGHCGGCGPCCRCGSDGAGKDAVQDQRSFADDRLFTVGEVAAAMRVSTMTVYRLIKAGELGALRIGRGYRIPEREVERYLSARRVGSGA